MLKIVSLFLVCFFATETNAYLVTSYNNQVLSYDKPTRILIAGRGDELGTQFQEVARGKAKKYLEQFPGQQIILLASEEPGIDNISLLRKWDFFLQRNYHSTFDGRVFVDEVEKFKKIASIDIFSHSSAQFGIHLDGKTHRLTTTTENLDRLIGHFMTNAYVILHGCNAGFNLAPFLSTMWGVPVAGALTSTNFQKLHSDGQFYLTEEGFYPSSDWAKSNALSFKNEVNCNAGMCLRLKPDNNGYTGFWGEYNDGGLPFYKFFCTKNSQVDCTKAMAQSLLSFVGNSKIDKNSSLDDYKKVAFDFLCPISAKKDLRKECETNLESALVSGDFTYNPFNRTQVECDFHGCKAKIKCQTIFITGIIKPGTCTLLNQFDGKSTTLVREFKAYLEGYKNLKN